VVVEADAHLQLAAKSLLQGERARLGLGPLHRLHGIGEERAAKPRASASSSLLKNCGFMNGSPPLNPISCGR
jgi:hypothetical protein